MTWERWTLVTLAAAALGLEKRSRSLGIWPVPLCSSPRQPPNAGGHGPTPNCGAGGAGMGYHLAGFEVTGVDVAPQENYPFEFHQADAMTFPLDGYDAIHASPPCQHYAPVTRWRGNADDHPDLLLPTVERLKAHGAPWVVENVPFAPISPDFVLCGSMFGLNVRRHRWFLTSWSGFALVPSCQHAGLLPFMHKGERAYADAMGCQWMSAKEAREAIPPAYTDWIGAELLAHMPCHCPCHRVIQDGLIPCPSCPTNPDHSSR